MSRFEIKEIRELSSQCQLKLQAGQILTALPYEFRHDEKQLPRKSMGTVALIMA